MTYQLLEESPATKRLMGQVFLERLEEGRRSLEVLAEFFSPWHSEPDPLIHSWRWLQKDRIVRITATRWKQIAR